MRTSFWATLVIAALALPVAALAAEPEYEVRGGKWVPLTQPAAGTPEGDLAVIRHLIDADQNVKAGQAARDFLKKYPDHPTREEALLLAGQAQLNRGRYWQAYDYFKQQVEQYPGGVYSERALNREYEIGDAFLQGKKRLVLGFLYVTARSEGVEILQRVAEQAPGSSIAEKSLLRVADYYYNRGEWAKAAQAYDQYLELFGKSNSAPYAALQAARATYGQYRGIRYDETPLLEAQQRFTTFSDRYPRAAERNNVPDITRSITDNRAGMAMEAGLFYMKNDRPEAAAFYFRLVLQRYPDTPAAEEARRILGVDEVETAPSAPPAGPSQPEKGSDMSEIFNPTTAPAAPAKPKGE